MKQRSILLTASLFGALAVTIGAFGAHALKEILLSTGRQETYELAVRYHLYHTLALLAAGILMEKFPALRVAAVFYIFGIVIFSGSLYILALTNQTLWGAVTPIGGVALIAGWLSFFWGIWKRPDA